MKQIFSREAQENKTRELVTAALFCALLCVIAPITIPLSSGVGITLSVLGVFLVAVFCRPRWAVMAIVCYLALGFLGVPVFSGWRGGADVLFGLTGGFIWSYIPMALMVSAAAKTKRTWLVALSMVGALAVCYACGTVWFVWAGHSSWKAALTACVVPFIPIDLAKAAAALVLYRTKNALFFARS